MQHGYVLETALDGKDEEFVPCWGDVFAVYSSAQVCVSVAE